MRGRPLAQAGENARPGWVVLVLAIRATVADHFYDGKRGDNMDRALRTNRLWKRILVVTLVSCAAFSPRIQPSQNAKVEKPNPKDEAEWTKAGFKAGWMEVKGADNAVFTEQEKTHGLPSFRYSRHYKRLDLTTPPVIAVPFGLFLDDSPIDDAFLEGLSRFQQMRMLCIRFGPVSGAGMREIANIKDLTHLEISSIGNRANVEESIQNKDFNDGVKNLTGLTKVAVLNLSETRIGDDGVKHLAKMKQLRILNLRATKVTNAGLDALAGLTELTTLDVRDTEITMDGVKRFKKALPNAIIHFKKD
jgi:hypothetical protein